MAVYLAVQVAEEGGGQARVEGREVFLESLQGEAVSQRVHEDLLVDGVEGELVLGLAAFDCAVGGQVRVVEALLITGVLNGFVLFLGRRFCGFQLIGQLRPGVVVPIDPALLGLRLVSSQQLIDI